MLESVIVSIAAVAGILSGIVAITSKINVFYMTMKKVSSSAHIEKVWLINKDGDKIVLENATIEQIKKFLEEESENAHDQEEL